MNALFVYGFLVGYAAAVTIRTVLKAVRIFTEELKRMDEMQ